MNEEKGKRFREKGEDKSKSTHTWNRSFSLVAAILPSSSTSSTSMTTPTTASSAISIIVSTVLIEVGVAVSTASAMMLLLVMVMRLESCTAGISRSISRLLLLLLLVAGIELLRLWWLLLWDLFSSCRRLVLLTLAMSDLSHDAMLGSNKVCGESIQVRHVLLWHYTRCNRMANKERIGKRVRSHERRSSSHALRNSSRDGLRWRRSPADRGLRCYGGWNRSRGDAADCHASTHRLQRMHNICRASSNWSSNNRHGVYWRRNDSSRWWNRSTNMGVDSHRSKRLENILGISWFG